MLRMNKTHHIDTRLMHTGSAPFDPATESAPVSLPSIRTSTVRFKSLDALDRAIARRASGERIAAYGRQGLDTHRAFEDLICELENATHSYIAPSGMAAITLAFVALLDAGDHALVADCVYGPTRILDHSLLERMDIEVTYFSAQDDLAALMRLNTRLLYVESPGSLLFETLDLPALAAFAQQHDLVLASDNTWGSGYLYRPLDLGAQVSVIAATKYIAGHSDVMLGAVATNDAKTAARLAKAHYALGYSVSADDVWLALRGARTLPLRLEQHARNALEVCRFFASRPETVRIFHPAWPDDPGHALWQRDFHGSNGMLSVALALEPAQARRFVDALTLFGIGFSWGGFESLVQLVEPSLIAPHDYWTLAPHALVRLQIGLEHIDDLIADLQQALDGAQA